MAIVSEYSAAISSSTGATIRHGPHHVAQKSTRTSLSLPSTSAAKVPSVTVKVFPAISVSPWGRTEVSGAGPGRGVATADQLGGEVGVTFAVLGQPALGVDRGRTSGAGRGHRLAVGVVHQVACGEHTVQVRVAGAAPLRVGHHITLVVHIDLTAHQRTAWVVADRYEHAGHREGRGLAGHRVTQRDTAHRALPQHLGDQRVELPPNLLVGPGPVHHDPRGTELL